MAETRRRREIRVLVAVVVAIVLLGALAVFLKVQGRDDDTGAAGPTPPPEPTVRPAEVHDTFHDACDALVDEGVRGKRGKAPALADKDEIARTYVDEGDGSVIGVGLTVCDRGWVIVVGVAHEKAKVPSVGTNGTPVVAYLQDPPSAQ